MKWEMRLLLYSFYVAFISLLYRFYTPLLESQTLEIQDQQCTLPGSKCHTIYFTVVIGSDRTDFGSYLYCKHSLLFAFALFSTYFRS